MQIRHRSAYYDAFFAEALMDFLRSGPGSDRDGESAYGAIKHMVRFCVETSRESVRAPQQGGTITVVTAIAPPPHSRMSRLFWRLKTDLGFGLYVPDCDKQDKAQLDKLGVAIGRFECGIDRVADPTAFFASLTLGEPTSKLVRE